ncbi:unnamed protein product [Chilo suppressalis]|uniref:C2H2-type domain-containing protein n=1 Tax=Chilo suppressalis TaxID=168631 RepID=A0ABN8AU56_CHISP|nr:unnamed protein product [Chilo suppressalis]
MAPLSHELAGLILPHEHYGSHLDCYGKTVDKDLEEKNFEYAGTTLPSIWNSLKVDGYDVNSEYIAPKEDDSNNAQILIDDWYYEHVRESQYLLQILKCSNEDCCGQTRSSLRSLLPNGFLPPPIKLQQTQNGLRVSQVNSDDGTYLNLFARLAVKLQPEAADFQQIPYDWFCPSVHDKLASRTCKECGIYHTSNKTLLQHLKNLHPKRKKKDEVVRRIQPTRIAARRARELLCILGDEKAGTENAEWIDDDEVDGSFENEEEDVAYRL